MTKKILTVDDEPNILELVKGILEAEDFDVITAEDGETALKKIESDKPDLVVLDMMMPGMSGREVAEKIREKDKEKKIVFLTVANFSEAGKNVLKELDVSDYITKPFDNSDLVKRIKKVIDG